MIKPNTIFFKKYNINNIRDIARLKEGIQEIFRRSELLHSKFSVVKVF